MWEETEGGRNREEQIQKLGQFRRVWKHTVIRHMEKPVSFPCEQRFWVLKLPVWALSTAGWSTELNSQDICTHHACTHPCTLTWKHASDKLRLCALHAPLCSNTVASLSHRSVNVLLKGGEILNSGFSMLQDCITAHLLQL